MKKTKARNPKWEDAYKIRDWENYISNDFNNESQLCDFIELNKEEFAREILEIEYLSHVREYYVKGKRRFKDKNTARVDFLFTSTSGENILVECKNPKNVYCDLRNGLIQLMAYYCDTKKSGIKVDRLVLLTTKFDIVIQEIIAEYKLNVEVIVFSKQHSMRLCIINN